MTSDDEYCPICKSSRYLNPLITFLIEPSCYHKMCSSCVDRLFGSGPSTCPVAGCSARLRSQRFRKQTFEDISVEREVDIRRRVAKVFNRREDEFGLNKREWDDYLEMVESLCFDLLSGDKRERELAEKRLADYEEGNRDEIRRNQQREKAEVLAFKANEEAEREVSRAAREAMMLEGEEEKKEAERSRRLQLEAMSKGDWEAVERIKEAAKKRAEERRRKALEDVANAKGIREGRQLALNSFLAKAGREEEQEEEEEVWEPLGKGVTDQPKWYSILDKYPKDTWVDPFVAEPRVGAGGYSKHEYYERSIHEAFEGLTIFLDEEEEKKKERGDRTDIMIVDAAS
ncbi:CDK-activating kinase assembly factor MAT1-domain-containing protein [Pyronema omphalodes]|nr:CDK-activating kinase assembly factor MAT1-domain-containing protein [Pyronema omphalodes]